MIELNLLPEEYRKKKVDLGEIFNRYRKFIVSGVGIFTGVVIVILLVIVVYPRLQAGTMRKLEKKWKNIEKKYEKVVRLKKRQKRLRDLLNNIDQVISSRIIWARRLNDISDNLPGEIQLTELATRIEKFKDKPDRMVLISSGIVPAYPGERAIGDFIKGLRENKDFIKDFTELEPPSTVTTPEGFKKFTIKCYAAATEPQKVKKETQKKK